MTIEVLKTEDLPQILEMYKELYPEKMLRNVTEEMAAHAYARLQADKDYKILVAKDGAEVLGTLLTIRCHSLIGDFLVYEDAVVKEGKRGAGIGTALFEASEKMALEEGCLYSMLCSSAFRKDAHRFYERFGFADEVRGFRKQLDWEE